MKILGIFEVCLRVFEKKNKEKKGRVGAWASKNI